jgi:hypothetical protein
MSARIDRVAERRRAVALARHYREFEGLTIQQIADRLGRAPATIKAYFYDPTRGEGARGQGPLPGGVPRLRRLHPAAQRQGRRVRVLQGVPPGRDRPALDARARAGCDARLAGPLRPAAVVVRLVTHARAQARAGGTRTTQRRRLALRQCGERLLRKLEGGSDSCRQSDRPGCWGSVVARASCLTTCGQLGGRNQRSPAKANGRAGNGSADRDSGPGCI